MNNFVYFATDNCETTFNLHIVPDQISRITCHRMRQLLKSGERPSIMQSSLKMRLSRSLLFRMVTKESNLDLIENGVQDGHVIRYLVRL